MSTGGGGAAGTERADSVASAGAVGLSEMPPRGWSLRDARSMRSGGLRRRSVSVVEGAGMLAARGDTRPVHVIVEEDATLFGGHRSRTVFDVPLERFTVARVEGEAVEKLSPALRRFVRKQNQTIEHVAKRYARAERRRQLEVHGPAMQAELEEEVESGRAEAELEEEEDGLGPTVAINLSFLGNVLLFLLKLAAAIYSGSLAVVGSTIESALDLLSGSILFVAARAAANHKPYLFPAGRARLEPLSVIVFASVMGTAALALIKEGAESLLNGLGADGPPTLRVDALTFGVMGSAVGTKLALLALCWGLRKESTSVAALTQDHINDSLSNAITLISVGLSSLGGYWWIVDPICAIVLALYVLVTWIETGREHVALMSGLGADPETLSAITLLAATHDPRIEHVELVRGYHFGSKLLVEVDIVMPPDTPLLIAHDVGESLQQMIELRPDVERAFVHVDYDAEHDPLDEHGALSRFRKSRKDATEPGSSEEDDETAPPRLTHAVTAPVGLPDVPESLEGFERSDSTMGAVSPRGVDSAAASVAAVAGHDGDGATAPVAEDADAGATPSPSAHLPPATPHP